MVGAVPVVDSPGSCREGAGSIPTARMALLREKRREDKQVAGCSECAPAAAFKARKPRALPEGAVVCFFLLEGAGVFPKKQRGAPTATGSAGIVVGCCRGRWCVYDDRRDRTSTIVVRVRTHTACQ